MLTTNLSNLPYLARKFIQFTCHGSLGSQYCGTDWALSPLPATDGWECSADNGHFSMVFFGSDLSYRHVCDLYLSFLLEPKHFLQLLMPLTLKVTLRTLSLRNFQEHRLFISF